MNRARSLRSLEVITNGAVKFVRYLPGGRGNYEIRVGDTTIVLQGTHLDAWLMGYSAGVQHMRPGSSVDPTTLTANIGLIQQSLTTEAWRRHLDIPRHLHLAPATATTPERITWQPVNNPLHYELRLVTTDTTITHTTPELHVPMSEIPESATGYEVTVRAVSADPREATDSPWSSPLIIH